MCIYILSVDGVLWGKVGISMCSLSKKIEMEKKFLFKSSQYHSTIDYQLQYVDHISPINYPVAYLGFGNRISAA